MKTAPEAPATPAPGVSGPGPGVVLSVPLHGPVDAADDSLEGQDQPSRASESRRWRPTLGRESGRGRRMLRKAWQTKEGTMGATQ